MKINIALRYELVICAAGPKSSELDHLLFLLLCGAATGAALFLVFEKFEREIFRRNFLVCAVGNDFGDRLVNPVA